MDEGGDFFKAGIPIPKTISAGKLLLVGAVMPKPDCKKPFKIGSPFGDILERLRIYRSENQEQSP